MSATAASVNAYDRSTFTRIATDLAELDGRPCPWGMCLSATAVVTMLAGGMTASETLTSCRPRSRVSSGGASVAADRASWPTSVPSYEASASRMRGPRCCRTITHLIEGR